MTRQSFRFNQHFFQSRMRSALDARTPRNPLMRFLLRALGLGLLVALVALGALVGVAMLTAGAVYRLLRGRGPTVIGGGASADPNVVEGEFRVVDKTSLPR